MCHLSNLQYDFPRQSDVRSSNTPGRNDKGSESCQACIPQLKGVERSHNTHRRTYSLLRCRMLKIGEAMVGICDMVKGESLSMVDLWMGVFFIFPPLLHVI